MSSIVSRRGLLIAIAGVVSLLGCVNTGSLVRGTPVIPSSTATAPSARYDDGIPRVFDGQPVLRGAAAIAHARATSDTTPFLVGGWVTNVPGDAVPCPALPIAGASAWLAPCGQPAFSDVAGDATGNVVADGELTFHFADVTGLQSGPAILRVHVHDPRASACGTGQLTCAGAMVVDEILWTGDAATAPHPLDIAAVSAALNRISPSATLAPLGNGVYGADCGTVPATTRDYVVTAPSPYIPTFSQVAIAPSPQALARALPIPAGVAGALDGGLIGVTGSRGGFDCRWLRLDNVAVLVRTSDPPRAADRTFMQRLVTALAAAVNHSVPSN